MKLGKKHLSMWMLILMLSFGLAACASEPDNNSGDGDTAGDGDSEGTGGDLVIDMQSEAVSLDPHTVNDVPSGNVQSNIYETLVYFDENMDIQTRLADSWEQIDDTTLQFTLREGITFTDGEVLNAEAVEANIERITDEAIASQRAFLFEDITDINVVDEQTIQFITEEPSASLVYSFAHNGGSMISPKSIEADYAAMEDGESPGSVISADPVGTGLFTLEEWQSGNSIQLVKNDDYWDEPAKLDSVTFRVVNEDGTRLANIETGSAHVSEPTSPSDVSRIENSADMELLETESLNISYIGFNTQSEPFDDVNVRRAISMAINNEDIVNNLFDGYGTPAKGPMAPGVVGYDDQLEPIEYDPEAAEELLAEAGYGDGFSMTISTNDTRERQDLATFVQAELENIGIDVSIEIVEWGAYLDQTAQGDTDMFVLGWSSATGDADYALAPLFHSDNVGDAGNRSFFQNDEVDALLDEAKYELEPAKRNELYSEAQQLIIDEAPMLFTHHKVDLNAYSNTVHNLYRHPTGDFWLQDVYID
ncbi:glutathione ABC transporter substrate-binding protein [Alkalicoccobacillus murimartini]|uniref:Peptide/nickel transport system substrate-binding protein n=1 Tax=Alkalicoccobacillus murimartini TaxID=171685 RepID=A0ABT9YN86_9BACI|nr:glutathione ABC transporter substrate-binding protein [Alkalicoccobacillus murimartini]MDQ0209335.1 peptide/nickel transport system substrate-binding protein [Alkalicoccobacillus murimartini]